MLREQFAQSVAQFVHVEVRRIDDEIGLALERPEQRAFARDAVTDTIGVRQRMPAAARLVPAYERRVGRVEEQDTRVGSIAAKLVDGRREVVDEVAAADVDDEGIANRLLGAARQLG